GAGGRQDPQLTSTQVSFGLGARRPDGKARRLSIWARKALAISTHADVSKDPDRECRGARGGRYPTGLAYSSIRHERSSRSCRACSALGLAERVGFVRL